MKKINKKISSFLVLMSGLVILSGCSDKNTVSTTSSEEVSSIENNQQNNQSSDTSIVTQEISEDKTLALNTTRCIGCGKCAQVDSEHFRISNHKASVISQKNLGSTALQNAIARCPVNIISLK